MNRIKDYGKLATDITTWIRDYATTNNIKSLVVGVSGGIDSAVVSTLCARTGMYTQCCNISIQSSIAHRLVAQSHMEWLQSQFSNVHTSRCFLDDTLQAFIDDTTSEHYDDHTFANTISRLRMVALYHMAAHIGAIVVGTGNKVEDFGIGFYTKYGDGSVDISPIADLYKTEVRELGKYLGISQEILEAKPTDGLWADGRTDEDQIGCTYEQLEFAMEKEHSYSPDYQDLNVSEEFKDLQQGIRIYRKLNKQNQHKMQPIPIYKLNQ